MRLCQAEQQVYNQDVIVKLKRVHEQVPGWLIWHLNFAVV
jgi:beta-mannanase